MFEVTILKWSVTVIMDFNPIQGEGSQNALPLLYQFFPYNLYKHKS